MEERYMYQVNTIMPILGLSVGIIKVPTSQKLTKDDVLICLKKAPVFRRFSDGNKERVGIDNIDRLHRENYMTVEEYNEYLANKTDNTVEEEKIEEPVVEESEPEVTPVVEESAPVEEVVEEETVEEEEVFIPVPEEAPIVEENTVEEESAVVEEDNDVVANELFDSVIENEVTEEEEIPEDNSNNNNNYFRNRKKKH